MDAPDVILEQEKSIPSTEELEIVVVMGPGKTTNIGATLPKDEKERLIKFFKGNADIFAWSHEDMADINPLIAIHRLKIDPRVKLVR